VNKLWDRCVCVCARAHTRACRVSKLWDRQKFSKSTSSIVEFYRKCTRAVTFRISGRCPSCRCPGGGRGGGGEWVHEDDFAQPRTHAAGARPSEIVVGCSVVWCGVVRCDVLVCWMWVRCFTWMRCGVLWCHTC
jgi:hypothetical protein